MDKRETYKDVDFNDRKWRINKFDAMTGSYIAYKLMAEALPMGLSSQIGIPEKANKSNKLMSKEDFFDLQKDCLKVCAEVLPAGPAPVIVDNGNWGVMGIENDTKTVLFLTVQALIWNVTGFFDESLLTSIAGAMSSIVPGAKT